MAYLSQVQENLPIFGIAKNKSLADFCTTERDVARGISRMPLVLARLYEEDIKFDKTAKPRSQFLLSPKSAAREQLSEDERLMANLNELSTARNSAQRESLHRRSVSRNSSEGRRNEQGPPEDFNP